ncbi:Uncharacterised protein [uncultured archaeon]|nr:Uncharacterised protein [uncultured archaeon]
MIDEPRHRGWFIALGPNKRRKDKDQICETFLQELREHFERNLTEAVERYWEVPPLYLKPSSGPYLELLVEARELYVDGHFYSCVAMCGIVGERLIKDMLRASVLIEKYGQNQRPSDAAFDQLEQVGVRRIVDFLNKTGLLSDDAAKAARELGEIRNIYAHASGKNPKKDAINSITFLHTIVEGYRIDLRGLRRMI